MASSFVCFLVVWVNVLVLVCSPLPPLPAQAVWKSLPGWIVLNRLHAAETVSLVNLLGGWGQEKKKKTGFMGTRAVYWKEEAAQPPTFEPTDQDEGAALLSAWGGDGISGGVFAPEEIFFPTVLSLLGYLRDRRRPRRTTDSAADDAAAEKEEPEEEEVKIAAVTFAEWTRRGEASPAQYNYFDSELVWRMRRTGALFGRKFTPKSVDLRRWQKVVMRLPSARGWMRRRREEEDPDAVAAATTAVRKRRNTKRL